MQQPYALRRVPCLAFLSLRTHGLSFVLSLVISNTLQFMGLDVVASSPPPNSTLLASAWPLVVVHESGLWQRACVCMEGRRACVEGRRWG
jgi:hypothetical protein